MQFGIDDRVIHAGSCAPIIRIVTRVGGAHPGIGTGTATHQPPSGIMTVRGIFRFVALAAGALVASCVAAHADAPASLASAGLLGSHGRLEVRAHRSLHIAPALRGTTQRVARRHAHRHHHYAAAHHELIERVASGAAPVAPTPARSRAPLSARAAVMHTVRSHGGSHRSTSRHATAAAWVMPDRSLPAGSAPIHARSASSRIESWRNAGRGPPRAGPDDALEPRRFAQRPPASFPGARPSAAPSDPDLHAAHAELRVAVTGRAPAARISWLPAPHPAKTSSVPFRSPEARVELHHAPAEGPAVAIPMPSSTGGSS